MKNSLRLSNRAARRVFLNRHALLETPQGAAHGSALADLIYRLGFVQLDSINTVARAHDLILFSRRPRYRSASLKNLYERDGALFEHWTHDAAVIPMAFYPRWQLPRARDAERLKKQWRNWRRDGFEARFQHVMDQIRDYGPVTSSDVGPDEARGSGGWWDWHPSKTALEYLWRSGALCVVGRDGFKKRYDLTERVIDEALQHPLCEPDNLDEVIDWFCSNALQRLGFATSGELAGFWGHLSPQECKNWCERQIGQGLIQPVTVMAHDGSSRQVFARSDLSEDPAIEAEACPRLRVLSPFDPVLRDRKRAEKLFGFSYRIEIFVPQARRKYGYYVFPILEGDKLIGRVDMKAFRDRDILKVKAVWPERGVRWGKGRQRAFEAELTRLQRLAGVSKADFEKGWLREPI